MNRWASPNSSLGPVLGGDKNPYLDSSCAVLESVDYDPLNASTSSTVHVSGFQHHQHQNLWMDSDYYDTKGKIPPPSPAPHLSESQGPDLSRPGVNLLDRRHIGLLVSVLVAGFMSSALKRGLLNLMESDLELTEYQSNAASSLLLLPWSFSFLLGFLSDSVPILGSRRRAYMLLGWIITFLAYFGVAFLNYVEEYDTKVAAAASGNDGNEEYADSEVTAENRGGIIAVYTFLLMVASLGVILSILMAEVHVVALCRDLESILERGAAIGTLLMTQFTGDTVGQIVADKVVFRITSFGITPLYSFRTIALFLMFLSLVPLPALVVGFRELSPSFLSDRDMSTTISRKSFLVRVKAHWRVLRGTLGERSTTAVTRFLFMFVFFSEFSISFPLETLANWCGVTAKTSSSSNIVQKVLYVCAVAMWKYNGLNANWRTHLALGYVLVFLGPEVIYFLVATFNESARNASTYAIMDALQGYVRALIVILEIAMAVEIAPVGGEGAVVGAIVSIATIMRLLAAAFSNLLSYAINEDASNSSSNDAESLVGFGLAVCFAIRALALFGLLFLPRQKLQLNRMHKRRRCVDGDDTGENEDDETRRNAQWTIGGFALAFSISLVFNWLAILPGTSCLPIVGGSGCG